MTLECLFTVDLRSREELVCLLLFFGTYWRTKFLCSEIFGAEQHRDSAQKFLYLHGTERIPKYAEESENQRLVQPLIIWSLNVYFLNLQEAAPEEEEEEEEEQQSFITIIIIKVYYLFY